MALDTHIAVAVVEREAVVVAAAREREEGRQQQSLGEEQDRRSRRNKTQRRPKSLHPCSQRRRLHVLAVAVTTAASSCEIASANRINVSCLISQRLVNDAFRYHA